MVYLIDKSALARMQHPAVEGRLAPIIESGEAATCSMVDLEVPVFDPEPEGTFASPRKAGACLPQGGLDGGGLQPGDRRPGASRRSRPGTGCRYRDLIIAAAAEAARMTVLHYDADFDTIAAVTGQAMEWVVPRGSL